MSKSPDESESPKADSYNRACGLLLSGAQGYTLAHRLS